MFAVASPALRIFTCFLLQWLFFAASWGKQMCREEERSALLVFKSSFFNETYCSYDASNSPRKMRSWMAGDCCDWGGIICDKEDGHVIGLDVSSSCLRGKLDSKTSIFDLIHLQDLNLVINSFHRSQIPSAMVHLTRLTRLNLSFCGLGGHVVPEMMRLPNLSLLDLSENSEMIISGLEDLLQNLTNIQELNLNRVSVSDSKVPRVLGNMTYLRSLALSECGLYGEFPYSIFELPNLELVDVSENYMLTGSLIGFHRGSPVKDINLFRTNFTGELPVWLGNLSHLTYLELSNCGFLGELPTSIGDLTKLEDLGLGGNKFHGPIPPSIGNLTSLTGLDLFRNRVSGEIPSSVGNLIRLEGLNLGSNQLTGEIPTSLSKLSQLSQLDLSSGNVPFRIGNLTSLFHLDLSFNKLSGPLPNSTYQLRPLFLNLASNYLTGTARLDLLEGASIYLSSNAFSSVTFPSTGSYSNAFDLSYNRIQGALPIPSNSTGYYLISNNQLSGEIPSSLCDLENIIMLNLADNDFIGVLPPCLGNLSFTLAALSLSGNNFNGKIPELNSENCELDTIDLSSNSFEGLLPRSLANCQMLKYVNFGINDITDIFPSWLGSLPSLKVLMLHSNRFHGWMTATSNNTSWFPSLKIIHLSMNKLQGPLPADCLVRWKAMKYPSPDDNDYPDPYVRMVTMAIIDKGIKRQFGKTLGYFTLVDLSSNNFSGTIPESIGENLLKLHTLNLSNNDFIGLIPLSLGNLQNLEVLDLSWNRLSGEIPGVLMQVTSLNHFNVSYNNLSGSIPEGNQFGTFENSSYIDNPELCGSPLTKKCGKLPQSTPSGRGNQGEKSSMPSDLARITTLVGLGGGLVIGVALEQAIGADVLCWLAGKWRKYR